MIKIKSNLISHAKNYMRSWALEKFKRESQEKNYFSLFFSFFLLDLELQEAPYVHSLLSWEFLTPQIRCAPSLLSFEKEVSLPL